MELQKIRIKIEKNILSLLSGGASKDNFTHWFTDIIPRIKYFQQNLSLIKLINIIYLA